jgi:hypothetical protein
MNFVAGKEVTLTGGEKEEKHPTGSNAFSVSR